MSAPDSESISSTVSLNEEDVAYLMYLLRNATQPVTTQQLIDALRRQSEQFRSGESFSPDSAAS